MSSEPLEPNHDVIIPRSRDRLGRPVYKAQLTRTDNQSEKVALVRQTAPLPVIFIPGSWEPTCATRQIKARSGGRRMVCGLWETSLPRLVRCGLGPGGAQRSVKNF